MKKDRNHKLAKTDSRKSDYTQLLAKLFLQLLGLAVLAVFFIYMFYKSVWNNKGGNWIVAVFQRTLGVDFMNAMHIYQRLFRNNEYLIWTLAVMTAFFLMLCFLLHSFTRYFDKIVQGIDALLNEDAVIRLPSEMSFIEHRLNTVRQTLQQRTWEAQSAERRKNDLVMYLAHDIRTPLTSIIGYLSLLEETPDIPAGQRAKYIQIALQKSYRLEKMVNEFFEITRYNLQQITLTKETIDLYYMLVQLSDELSPILSENGNHTRLNADENLTLYGDPDQLARVFNNVLKNAAAYSDPDTEILITATKKDHHIILTFQNQGPDIPQEKLNMIFEKFYRLDESRTSNTGGSGLGLAIAREIITLHGGTITARSADHTVSFIITLPL